MCNLRKALRHQGPGVRGGRTGDPVVGGWAEVPGGRRAQAFGVCRAEPARDGPMTLVVCGRGEGGGRELTAVEGYAKGCGVGYAAGAGAAAAITREREREAGRGHRERAALM
eukprot:scaffold9492_cov108-Isochrysis_galbana.AAC.7